MGHDMKKLLLLTIPLAIVGCSNPQEMPENVTDFINANANLCSDGKVKRHEIESFPARYSGQYIMDLSTWCQDGTYVYRRYDFTIKPKSSLSFQQDTQE